MPPSMWIRFLGTSSQPNATRNFSSDCGESTQRQLAIRGIGGGDKLSNIRHILITHLHQDHVLGLVPLLASMMGPSASTETGSSSTPRVEIYGPSGLRALVRLTLSLCYLTEANNKYAVHELLWPNEPSYNLPSPGLIVDPDESLLGAIRGEPRTVPHIPPHVNELPGRDYRMDESTASWPQFAQVAGLQISAAPILHRCPTLGYVFQEPDLPTPIPEHDLLLMDANAAALAEQGIKHPRSLIRTLQKDREPITLPDGNVIHPPPLDIIGRKVVVLGDTFDATGGLTDPQMGMTALAGGADVLVHECTNAALPPELTQGKKVETVEEVRAKALLRGHSIPQGAGAFAGRIRAQALLLNHFSVKYNAPPPWIENVRPRFEGNASTASSWRSKVEPVSADVTASDSTSLVPPTLSEPEKRLQAMREIETQATEAWHAGMLASSAEEPEDAQVWRTRKAIAAHDGLLYEVLRRGQPEGERQDVHSEDTPQGFAGRGRGSRGFVSGRGIFEARGGSEARGRGRGTVPRRH